MKTPSPRGKSRSAPIPSVIVDPDPSPGAAERLRRIAEAAYYKAEARGFVPGQEMDDWLEAEAEIDETEEGGA